MGNNISNNNSSIISNYDKGNNNNEIIDYELPNSYDPRKIFWDVDGNLRSFIRQVRPSGSNVSVPTPTATGSGLL